ncbi:protein kinase domain-containing protein [Phthorimaea operculella]|nr:protein kinase domain-containing protein [Phthorimaea operculella]
MPRRGNDVAQLQMPAKKKAKLLEEPPPSLDVSFFDDEALPPGIVFSDALQKQWRIGKPIGRGSFGRIYLASDEVDKEVTKANARYVVKIEPHTNGPLFVEVHCLVRVAQVDKIKSWRQSHKQKRLGMPVYIASGSFTEENTGVKYRFLVLPRYDIDLQKVIARTKVLDLKNVLVLAIQILDVLEYLHDQGYTHSDIKSSNLMLGFEAGKLNKVPVVKPAPSFQKETKEVAVLAGKHRRAKSAKARSSNYYDDEDYIAKDKGDNSEDEDVANVKRKLRKILSDRDNRTLHRNHAFNLRQLSNYVNYEDLNSSVCSDQSYQKLLDDFGPKPFIRTTQDYYEDMKRQGKVNTGTNLSEIYQEAIKSQSSGHIYLLDYGLASKFLDSEGKHKDFGMDARKAHDGTLEYSSRDSHIGAHSRRSDLETLGYNLLDWLTGTLPWKTTEVLAEPDLVHALKKNFMGDIKSFLKTCFKTDLYPEFMEKYLEYVTKLDFTEKPDYDYCRSLFKSELLKNGYNKDICLNFAEAPMSPMSRKLCYSKRFGKKNTPPDFLARSGIKKAYERENVTSLENDLKLELLKQTLNSSSDGFRKPCTSRNFFISDTDLVARLKKSLMPYDVFGKKLSPKNLRSNKKNIKKRRGVRKHRNSIGKFGNFMGSARQFTWAEILAGNPEHIIRKERNAAGSEEEDFDEETCKFRIRKLSDASETSDANMQSPLLQIDYLESMNPTYAMKEVVANFQNKVSGKNSKDSDDRPEGFEGYTPAMINVYKMKEKREAKERAEMLKQQYLTKEPVVVLPRCTRSKKTTGKKAESTRSVRYKTFSESSTDEDPDNQKVSRTRTLQKTSTDNKHKQTEKITRKARKQTVSDKSDSDQEKTAKSGSKISRKAKQRVISDSEKEKSDSETENVPKKRTRQKTASVETMDEDKVTPKTVSRNTKNISKKEVKIVERKPPSIRCKKSPPRARAAATAPINRRRLRSSRRQRS